MSANLKHTTQLKQISIVSFLTAILYLVVSISDYYIAPSELLQTMLLFHLYILPSLLISISILAYLKKQNQLMLVLLIIAPIVAAISNIIVISSFSHYSMYSAEVYLIIFWIFTVSGLSFFQAILSATIVLIISSVASFTLLEYSEKELFMHIFWMFAAYIFGLVGSYLLFDSTNKTLQHKKELSIEVNNKNILLKELFHRTKNNLQIVSSVLSIQSKKIKDTVALNIVQESIQTIKSISLIHENFYISDNLEIVRFNDYITNLVDMTKQTLNAQDIEFIVSCENINVPLQDAVPTGLIINEIFTNSIKHAFKGNSDSKVIKIKASLQKTYMILYISDNGRGIDENNFQESFGYKLIDRLIKFQLKGEVKTFNNNGLHYELKIPL